MRRAVLRLVHFGVSLVVILVSLSLVAQGETVTINVDANAANRHDDVSQYASINSRNAHRRLDLAEKRKRYVQERPKSPGATVNLAGVEPWCEPLVHAMKTAVSDTHHVKFCWRDSPELLCKGFGFDDESAASVRQHMHSLNLHPQTGEPLDQAWLSQYPASRTMPEMLEQPVLIYPDDEYDMVVEQVKEEHLPSYPTLEKFRSDLRTVFKIKGVNDLEKRLENSSKTRVMFNQMAISGGHTVPLPLLPNGIPNDLAKSTQSVMGAAWSTLVEPLTNVFSQHQIPMGFPQEKFTMVVDVNREVGKGTKAASTSTSANTNSATSAEESGTWTSVLGEADRKSGPKWKAKVGTDGAGGRSQSNGGGGTKRVKLEVGWWEDLQKVRAALTKQHQLSKCETDAVVQQVGNAMESLNVPWANVHAPQPFSWLQEFEKHEWKLFSQNGEDGVLEWIFYNIGAGSRYYVEFGAEDGMECNTRYMREHFGWTGLLMDGSYRNHEINLRQEYIYSYNINYIFDKYQVPMNLDLLSIDLDFSDYWVWKALDSKYRPRVVVLEINGKIPPHENKVVDEYDKTGWLRDDHYGIGLKAAAALGQFKGYTLVYQESRGVNAFFIRDDVLGEEGKKMAKSLEDIYRPANHYNGRRSVHNPIAPQDINKRKWVWNDLPYKNAKP